VASRAGKRALVLLGVAACLGIAASGCGSSSSPSSSTTAAKNEVAGSADSPSASTAAATSGEGGGSTSSKSNSTPATPSVGSGGPETNANGAPLGSNTAKNGDNSIQTYGSEVNGAEKAAAIAAMRSFTNAIANRDFATVCAGLSSKIRGGLTQANRDCPQMLETLVIIPPSEAHASASGTVAQVRIGGGNAFVLFRPVGSSELDYFVMRMEDGKWKSLGLTVGTPLSPSVPSGQQ
jgi:hypothetical protein